MKRWTASAGALGAGRWFTESWGFPISACMENTLSVKLNNRFFSFFFFLPQSFCKPRERQLLLTEVVALAAESVTCSSAQAFVRGAVGLVWGCERLGTSWSFWPCFLQFWIYWFNAKDLPSHCIHLSFFFLS